MKGLKEFLLEAEQLKKHHISVVCSHPQTDQHNVEKIEKVMAPDPESAREIARKRFRSYGYEVHSVTARG